MAPWDTSTINQTLEDVCEVRLGSCGSAGPVMQSCEAPAQCPVLCCVGLCCCGCCSTMGHWQPDRCLPHFLHPKHYVGLPAFLLWGPDEPTLQACSGHLDANWCLGKWMCSLGTLNATLSSAGGKSSFYKPVSSQVEHSSLLQAG